MLQKICVLHRNVIISIFDPHLESKDACEKHPACVYCRQNSLMPLRRCVVVWEQSISLNVSAGHTHIELIRYSICILRHTHPLMRWLHQRHPQRKFIVVVSVVKFIEVNTFIGLVRVRFAISLFIHSYACSCINIDMIYSQPKMPSNHIKVNCE